MCALGSVVIGVGLRLIAKVLTDIHIHVREASGVQRGLQPGRGLLQPLHSLGLPGSHHNAHLMLCRFHGNLQLTQGFRVQPHRCFLYTIAQLELQLHGQLLGIGDRDRRGCNCRSGDRPRQCRLHRRLHTQRRPQRFAGRVTRGRRLQCGSDRAMAGHPLNLVQGCGLHRAGRIRW